MNEPVKHEEVPWDDLDPGIRDVVRFLWSHGFETRDSGDGVSKFEGEDAERWRDCANDFPHVVIQVANPARLTMAADRLLTVLRGEGVNVSAQDSEGFGQINIQASYDPTNGISVVLMSGLDDKGLALARAKKR